MDTSCLMTEMASAGGLFYWTYQFITTHMLMISGWNSFRKHISALHHDIWGIYFAIWDELLQNDSLNFEVSSFSREIHSPSWVPLAILIWMCHFVPISAPPSESSVFLNGTQIFLTSQSPILKVNKIKSPCFTESWIHRHFLGGPVL